MFHDRALGEGGANTVRREDPAVWRDGGALRLQHPVSQGYVVGYDNVARFGAISDPVVSDVGSSVDNHPFDQFRRWNGYEAVRNHGGDEAITSRDLVGLVLYGAGVSVNEDVQG